VLVVALSFLWSYYWYVSELSAVFILMWLTLIWVEVLAEVDPP